MNWPEPLILASTSPRRRELLALAGIDAITLSPKIDDSHFVCGTMSPREWVTTLAILKASSICGSSDLEEGTVLSADTVCVVDGNILGQPKNATDARKMILSMTNTSHEVLTGWCLKTMDGQHSKHGCELTIVKIGEINQEDIDTYMESGMWQGKAGGYNLSERHSAGWPLTWQGDPTSVMGLPMHRLTVELTRK